ncbi:MAG: hypothetical protein QM572_17955 [Nocardioides sp.]|uniref:hypothetical protein n=1 Tax=Nocardioides sp. TaxID=35761 RepID=UPI0039E3B75A
MKLAVGQSLVSSVDSTTVIVTRAGDEEVSLACGGVEMVTVGADPVEGVADPHLQAGALLGKRYVDGAGTVEVLVTKGGSGTLTLDGESMGILGAKPLPASD